MSQKFSKFTLGVIYFTFFVDNLCWSVVFPIFAPYFLDEHNILFSKEVTEATRTTLLGVFLMAFPLGQFLGAPLLGEYADRSGRKKALLVSAFFTLIGLLLTAWSMKVHALWLLFFGRLITGLFAGNTSICLACVSDLSSNETIKARYFGYFSVLAGLSFVMGAFLGGSLSDPTVHPSFSPDLPLWGASIFTLLNLAFIAWGVRETAKVDPNVRFDFFESFRNIGVALKTKKIKRVYSIYFLFLFTWTIVFQFTPVLVVDKFDFTASDIGKLAFYMGVLWAVGSGTLNQFLTSRFSPIRVLDWCLILFTIFCSLLVFPKELWVVLSILGVCVILGGLAWPLCTGMISSMAPANIQGKILGMSQSVQSFAMSVAPALGGVATQITPSFPFFMGTFSGLMAAIIYFSLHRRLPQD